MISLITVNSSVEYVRIFILKILKRSIQALAERNELIRTIFPLLEGTPVRKLVPANEIELIIEDYSDLSEKEIKEKIRGNFEKPFNLNIEGPYRFFLYKKTSTEFILQIIIHHIAITMDVYVQIPVQLAQIYSSLTAEGNESIDYNNLTYSEFVLDQYDDFLTERFNINKKFWSEYLLGYLPKPVLPFSRKDSESKQDRYCKETFIEEIDVKIVEKLKNIATANNISLFSLLISCYQILLCNYTDQDESIIGIPVDTRKSKYKNVLGYTANTLPLRTKIIPNQDFLIFCQESKLRHKKYIKTSFISTYRDYE